MSPAERTRLRALYEGIALPLSSAQTDDTAIEIADAEGVYVGSVDIDDGPLFDASESTEAHAALIVGAVNALPALLDALEAADRAVERAGGACGRLRRERDDARAEVETLRAEAALMREQLAAATARVEELEESAAMACQSPADDCDCAGCLYAAERGGGS